MRPPPQCQGVLLCLQRLLNLPTERQAELLLFSIYALQRDAVFHGHEAKRFDARRLAMRCQSQTRSASMLLSPVERSKRALGGVLTV